MNKQTLHFHKDQLLTANFEVQTSDLLSSSTSRPANKESLKAGKLTRKLGNVGLVLCLRSNAHEPAYVHIKLRVRLITLTDKSSGTCKFKVRFRSS